jgi:hypothetical protein
LGRSQEKGVKENIEEETAPAEPETDFNQSKSSLSSTNQNQVYHQPSNQKKVILRHQMQ